MRAATCSSAPPCSKGFQAFLASSACAASATSYHSCSAAPLPWPSAFSWAAPVFKAGRSLLAFGSNSALTADRPTAATWPLDFWAARILLPKGFWIYGAKNEHSPRVISPMNSCSQPRKNQYGLLLLNLRIQLSWLGMWSPAKLLRHIFTPDGQDTWTILSGEGQYQIDEQGNTVAIAAGDIVVANKGQVHGVLCTQRWPTSVYFSGCAFGCWL